MPSGLVVKLGNYGFPLTFTVLNADGTAKNLTGLTVTFEVWTTEVNPTRQFQGVCTLTSPTTGVCQYTVASGNFNTLGQFYADLIITSSGYNEETETFTINVIPNAP